MNKALKNSDRRFIRTEKARIRRQFLDKKKQEELITELYKRFLGSPKPVEAGSETKKVEKVAAKPAKKSKAKAAPKAKKAKAK